MQGGTPPGLYDWERRLRVGELIVDGDEPGYEAEVGTRKAGIAGKHSGGGPLADIVTPHASMTKKDF